MSEMGAPLGVYRLAQRRPEQGGLNIVDCQGIACMEPVDVSLIDQLDEGLPRVPVEDYGGPEDPEDEAVGALVPKEPVKLIVVDGKGGFPCEASAKCELLNRLRREPESIGVNKDAVLTVFLPSAGHEITRNEAPELLDGEVPAVLQDNCAVHSRFTDQVPGTFLQLKIFGENGRPMEAGWRNPFLGHLLEGCQRGFRELRQGEIRRVILRHNKGHFYDAPSLIVSCTHPCTFPPLLS